MKHFFYFLLITFILYSCNNSSNDKNKTLSKKYITDKISCDIADEESFDTTFIFKGNEYKLICKTECLNDYSVADTLNDSTINLYQERIFNFTLKGLQIEKKFNVTKDLIKDKYDDNLTFNKSLLVFPSVDSIDTINNSIIINSLFMYPSGLGGTDFFERIIFEITLDGDVIFKKIIPYEQPGID